MSRAGSGENPATAEARVNPPRPIRKSLRWPNLSPSRPPTTSRTPMASMYAGPNHLIRLSPPWSSPAMVGAAMFVTVASITSTASASSTRPRIAHIRRLERRVVTVPGFVKVVVVMRNVLLGSVGAPLLGGLIPPTNTSDPIRHRLRNFENFRRDNGPFSRRYLDADNVHYVKLDFERPSRA